VYDHQEDPQEARNLVQDGKAKVDLMMALNATLNGRIDEEVGVDDGVAPAADLTICRPGAVGGSAASLAVRTLIRMQG
jgi:hypothetical protein